MPLTFPRAPTPVRGDPITSTQARDMARAVNRRLQSGLADGCYRILFERFSLWRQVRGPDADGNWPSMAEFFEVWMHADPDESDLEFPLAPAGEPEGANLANPMMGFVFGNPDVVSEGNRLSEVLEAASSDQGYWEAGKRQRGIRLADGSDANAVAFVKAQDFYRIAFGGENVQGGKTTMGRTYGGFMPIPELIGPCLPGADGSVFPNYRIIFNPIIPGLPVVTFEGTCPPDSPTFTPSHVIWITRTPFSYYIFLGDGSVQKLSIDEYILGPNAGGAAVMKMNGEHLQRCLNLYIKDYRGTDSQRATDGYRVENYAFDFERFLISQYALAPNIGHMEGDTPIYDYPLFTFDGGPFSSGDLAAYSGGGNSHAYSPGYLLTGFLVRPTGLQGSVTIEILNGTTVVYSLAVTQGDPVAVWLSQPVFPEPLRIRLATAATFDTGGSLTIECTEQLAYKPAFHDAYLVLRLLSTLGQADGMDNRGKDCGEAKELSDAYFAQHALISTRADAPGDATVAVNYNPVFDSSRAFTRDHTRIIPRANVIGYEVAGGKSILYFRRFVTTAPGNLDMFKGIAPSRDQVVSGQIAEGVVYEVRAETVNYNGAAYLAGQTFAGLAGIATFTGGLIVYEHEGIVPVARKAGLTNEWLMFEQFKAYHPEESSGWKPSTYSDYFALSERCHFGNNFDALPDRNAHDLIDHFSYGNDLQIAPEAPTGWRYARGSNNPQGEDDPEIRRNFYKSCRIYETPNDIESATVLFEGGDEIVKLVFKTRFHHCDEAPGTIGRNVATWDFTALRNEPHRSTENGIREYLVNQASVLECSRKIGDKGFRSNVWEQDDNPFGTCYPHFCFIHLVPEPYEDTNSTYQITDTKGVCDMMLQVETYLRAMCEGYVDGQTSISLGCNSGLNTMWDYTYENLCFEAFGGRWQPLMPLAKRPDKPQGFGSMVNTAPDAERFADLGKCLNLLTKVRVMLPIQILTNLEAYQDETPIVPDWPSGGPECNAGLQHVISFSETAPIPTTLVGSVPWGALASPGVNPVLFSVSISGECDGTSYKKVAFMQKAGFKIDLIDPDSILAVPEILRDLISQENSGLLGFRVDTDSGQTAVEVATQEESEPVDGVPLFWDGTIGYRFDDFNEIVETDCQVYLGGVLTPDPPSPKVLAMGRIGVAGTLFQVASQRDLSLSFSEDIPTFIHVNLV